MQAAPLESIKDAEPLHGKQEEVMQAAPSKEVLEAEDQEQTQQEEVKQAAPSKEEEESASTQQDKQKQTQEEVKAAAGNRFIKLAEKVITSKVSAARSNTKVSS